jgi:hypothetical protein
VLGSDYNITPQPVNLLQERITLPRVDPSPPLLYNKPVSSMGRMASALSTPTTRKRSNVLWPLLILFCALILLTQWITKHIQGIGLLLTRDGEAALIVYFCLILPGVVIHELSHALVAWVLGVKVRRLSIGITRKRRGGSVALGSVEMAHADPFRSSLIGLAPLIAGTVVILLIGSQVFGLRPFVVNDPNKLWSELQSIYRTPDFWLWVYLVFAISNAMLPSTADRHAWGTALLFIGVLVVFAYLTGLVQSLTSGSFVLTTSSWGRHAADQLTWAFGITVAVDVIIAAILFVTEQTLGLLGFGRLQYR